MAKEMNMVKLWMQQATSDEQMTLAARAGTSRGHLYQLSAANRGCSPEKARAVAEASREMHKESKGRLPILYVTDLSKACAGCAYAQKCLGPAAVRADFPIVTEDA